MSTLPSMTPVVPVHNSRDWLEGTLRQLRQALDNSPWSDSRIVVVDDGSSDGSDQVLAALTEPLRLAVVRQDNRGRLAARMTGVLRAQSELVLLVDSRVHVGALALQHLAQEMRSDPNAVVWNGDVSVASEGNPYAGFWSAITVIGWRRWFSDPRRISYGLDEFDRYPKGTTMFVAPREWLKEESRTLESRYDDQHLRSDDTALIRGLAARSRIHMSPGFNCRYHGRDALLPFLRQGFHRGTTFVDGYLGQPSPVGRGLTAGLLLAPVLAPVAVRRPLRTVLVGAAAAVTGAAVSVRSGASRRDAAALVLLSPAFVVSFGSGLCRGLVLAGSTAARRRRRRT